MALKTYHGSCHCKAITFEADLDLAQGTGKCNCSICWKARNWSIGIKPDAFRPLTGHEGISTYQFGTKSGFHGFCGTCGVRTYGWGNIPEIGGEYVSIALAALDDLPLEDLIAAPVNYFDGRNNSWWTRPDEIRHL